MLFGEDERLRRAYRDQEKRDALAQDESDDLAAVMASESQPV